MATNKRSTGWREAKSLFFCKWYFDISHNQTELSTSEALPTTEQAVLHGSICRKHKGNHISQLPPMLPFCQTPNCFIKWSRSQEKKQRKRFWKQSFISVFWTLRGRWELLLFLLYRSFFSSAGFYNPWLSTDRQALPTTYPVCGFQVLAHNSLCHHEELAG